MAFKFNKRSRTASANATEEPTTQATDIQAAARAALPDKPCFRAAMRDDGILELLIYEDIGEDFWSGGGLTAKTVKQQIDAAGAYSRISLRINSPGGDAFEGVAIGNLLKSTGKPVDVSIDGIAASAASIIAMCGTTITMPNNAMMMIHNAWTFAAGNAAALRKTADTLEKVDAAIAQTYVDRTGQSLEDIQALMDEETWMSAEDCLEAGFCTAIQEDPEGQDRAMAFARRFKALQLFAKLPQSLKKNDDDLDCACKCDNCAGGKCADCSNEDCTSKDCMDCPMQSAKAKKAEAAASPPSPEAPPAATPAAAAPVVPPPAVATPKAAAAPEPVPAPVPPGAEAAPAAPQADIGEDECACECQPCVDGNCANCCNSKCADPNCENCPMQSGTEDASNLSFYQAKVWEMERRANASA